MSSRRAGNTLEVTQEKQKAFLKSLDALFSKRKGAQSLKPFSKKDLLEKHPLFSNRDFRDWLFQQGVRINILPDNRVQVNYTPSKRCHVRNPNDAKLETFFNNSIY